MKYAVIECINGNFLIKSEHGNKESAFTKFHSECAGLWAAQDVITAEVRVVDENLDTVEDKQEYIFHTVSELEE